MPFSHWVKQEALVRSRRCCCVCQEFAGRATNVHHMLPESNGGSNDLENAIVLCLRCHAEVGHYNVRHPIGNKYSPEELRRHRDEWWEWCENNPAVPLPKHPISVSPGAINLGTRGWRACSPFKVHNKANEVYYQVFVKLTIDAPGVLPKHIGIEVAKPKDELSAEVGPVTVSGDIFRMNGTDEAGSKAVFLWLASLNPGEVCTFILTNNSPSQSSASTHPKVLIGVCDFAQEPAPMVRRGAEVAWRFTAPENISVEGLVVRVRRTR